MKMMANLDKQMQNIFFKHPNFDNFSQNTLMLSYNW